MTVSKEDPGFGLGVELVGRKRIRIKTPGGEYVDLEARMPGWFPKVKKENALSRKSFEAITVLTLLTRELFHDDSGGVGQDSFYVSLEKTISEEYSQKGREEAFRLACARLGNEGTSAKKAAKLVMIFNAQLRGQSLEMVAEDKKQIFIGQLHTEILRRYPRNFPRDRNRPRS